MTEVTENKLKNACRYCEIAFSVIFAMYLVFGGISLFHSAEVFLVGYISSFFCFYVLGVFGIVLVVLRRKSFFIDMEANWLFLFPSILVFVVIFAFTLYFSIDVFTILEGFIWLLWLPIFLQTIWLFELLSIFKDEKLGKISCRLCFSIWIPLRIALYFASIVVMVIFLAMP